MSQKKASALTQKAIQLMKSNQHALAINHLERVLNISPNDLAALMNLGVCKYTQSEFSEAAKIFHKLHEEQPENALINKYAGISYMQFGQHDLALKFLSRALKETPNDIDLLSSISSLLISMNRETDAIYFATQAVALDPTNSSNYNNLGSCLFNINRYKDAITCYQTSLELEPNNFIALSNYANSLDKIFEYKESIAAYEQCLLTTGLTDQQSNEIHYKMSLPLLASGRLVEGWENFEYGLLYKDRQSRKPQRKFSIPKWTGEKISNKTLLIWREQGLGDELTYLTLVPRLFEYCKDIIIECDTRLITLLQRSFPTCRVREQSYNPATLEQNSDHDFDYHLPIGSLPRFFLTSDVDFYKNVPYLIPNKDRVCEFDDRIKGITKKPVIGICWRSGINNSVRNSNYTSISDWESIFRLENVSFVNLQYGECTNELMAIKDSLGIDIINFEDIDLKNDLEAVSALIATLDCVVSAGTAVASLTAAVGTRLKIYKNPGWDDLGSNIYPWCPNNVDVYLTDHSNDLKSLLNIIAADLNSIYK